MDLKQEITTAAQLLVLLCLLYWSFTWNIPANFKEVYGKNSKFKLERNSMKRNDLPLVLSKHSVLLETAKRIRRKTKIDSPIASLIPPFNEWKEAEIIKQELKSNEVRMLDTQVKSKRKLNYASSKCGGKVLSSNKESKHRMAILTESADEYMLNPCKAKQWFVIELCDTIEVTQIEMANYELYSSSPKTFSVFWSEVYPTHSWHLLGSFEASDKRTLETFQIKTRNLGKFIKILIFSHHGKEHYCTLSTVRVLGYSMVYQLEEEEIKQLEKKNLEFKYNTVANTQKEVSNTTKPSNIPETSQLVNASLDSFSKPPSETTLSSTSNNFAKQKICKSNFPFFYKSLAQKSNYSSMCFSKGKKNVYDRSSPNRRDSPNHMKNCTKNNNLTNILENVCSVTAIKKILNITCKKNASGETLKVDLKNDMKLSKILKSSTFVEHDETAKSVNHLELNELDGNTKTFVSKDIPCVCENRSENNVESQKISNQQPDMAKYESLEDSAALIQKESVLIKLTSRINSLEFDISLINKYLQELSQSYRLQIEDMNTLFNETVKAINIASDKAIIIDKHQQHEIEQMEHKMRILSNKVDYLLMSQHSVIKQVIELHAFFLVLEFIIISTIFTVFMNSLKRSHFFYYKRNLKMDESINDCKSCKSYLTPKLKQCKF